MEVSFEICVNPGTGAGGHPPHGGVWLVLAALRQAENVCCRSLSLQLSANYSPPPFGLLETSGSRPFRPVTLEASARNGSLGSLDRNDLRQGALLSVANDS